ncbi:FAD-dependent oxidoreductase [Enterococcus avium]|uniref:FAD-dependent oxidoreductase n=1 Tax=Enterococcus avium TaxID=33945 RepID=UPI002AAFFFA9|nr:FAD-dependent oxidoreductase [Enterococcus avium]
MIKTDEYMRTSAEDVFAVGDATLIHTTRSNNSQYCSATNARRQGRYAVKNLEEANYPSLVCRAHRPCVYLITSSHQLD